MASVLVSLRSTIEAGRNPFPGGTPAVASQIFGTGQRPSLQGGPKATNAVRAVRLDKANPPNATPNLHELDSPQRNSISRRSFHLDVAGYPKNAVTRLGFERGSANSLRNAISNTPPTAPTAGDEVLGVRRTGGDDRA